MWKKKEKRTAEERWLDRRNKKTLQQRLEKVTYMQASLTLFGLSVFLFLLCLWRSVATGGTAGMGIAFIGLLAFFTALAGIGVTLYGHFIVKIEGRIKWIAGVATNGMMFIIMVLLYGSGIR